MSWVCECGYDNDIMALPCFQCGRERAQEAPAPISNDSISNSPSPVDEMVAGYAAPESVTETQEFVSPIEDENLPTTQRKGRAFLQLTGIIVVGLIVFIGAAGLMGGFNSTDDGSKASSDKLATKDESTTTAYFSTTEKQKPTTTTKDEESLPSPAVGKFTNLVTLAKFQSGFLAMQLTHHCQKMAHL